MNSFKLASIEEAIQDFKDGKFVIVVDDEDRENEGDLIMAAEMVTPVETRTSGAGKHQYAGHAFHRDRRPS